MGMDEWSVFGRIVGTAIVLSVIKHLCLQIYKRIREALLIEEPTNPFDPKAYDGYSMTDPRRRNHDPWLQWESKSLRQRRIEIAQMAALDVLLTGVALFVCVVIWL